MKKITIRGVTLGEGSPKICVPIVGVREEEILEMADAIVRSAAHMAEWRADWYEKAEDNIKVRDLLKKLRQHLKTTPLLVTFRTKAEGGEKAISPEEYEEFCNFVAASAEADLIDVELSMGKERIERIVWEAHAQRKAVILSSHDFSGTPDKEELIRRLCIMQELDGDISKIAVMPNSKKDVLTLMDATLTMKETFADRPMITMSMSGKGSISRLAGEFFGSDVTFGMLGKASAPGQVPAWELKDSIQIIHRAMRENKAKKNLYLIGFMGCGKSTIAGQLEKTYQMTRVEMDEEIVKQQGMSIADLFEKYGEAHFRKIESHFLKELQESQNMVVSCGGGVVLKPENVACMKENGVIVLLTASPETILQRVRYDEKRPLLKGKKNIADIQELMEARREKYEAAADFCVATDDKTAKEIALEIMKKLQ